MRLFAAAAKVHHTLWREVIYKRSTILNKFKVENSVAPRL